MCLDTYYNYVYYIRNGISVDVLDTAVFVVSSVFYSVLRKVELALSELFMKISNILLQNRRDMLY